MQSLLTSDLPNTAVLVTSQDARDGTAAEGYKPTAAKMEGTKEVPKIGYRDKKTRRLWVSLHSGRVLGGVGRRSNEVFATPASRVGGRISVLQAKRPGHKAKRLHNGAAGQGRIRHTRSKQNTKANRTNNPPSAAQQIPRQARPGV